MIYKVKIRASIKDIRSEAMQLDGKVFNFIDGWVMTEEDTSIYIGETAMIARDENYPVDAPAWIASGDLIAL